MRALLAFITARKSSWIVLVGALAATVAALTVGPGPGAEAGTHESADSLESIRAARILEDFPSADSTSAILVYSRDGAVLTGADVTAIGESAATLAELASDPVPPVQLSDDGRAAIVVVPLGWEHDIPAQVERAEALRSTANDGLPAGLNALLTGNEGFSVDVGVIFGGMNTTLLLTTVIVVALLLLITYRSPWLWIIPLTVVGLADAIAGVVAARVAAFFVAPVDSTITSILSVLVFGAGTNYALLLIARYRDELREVPDRREAMRRSLRAAGPAVIASGSTVVLSLLMMMFGQLESNRVLGLACAIGVLVAMLFVLLVLPPALTLFGRWLFWPLVPRLGAVARRSGGFWVRLGGGVARKPITIAVFGALLLGGLALGATQVKVGLEEKDTFITAPESVQGLNIITESFPAGSTAPAMIVIDEGLAEDAVAVAESISGVDSAAVVEISDGFASIAVVLDDASGSQAAFSTIDRLRDALDAVGDGEALVGGMDAMSNDYGDAMAADQNLIIPLILVVVLLVLVILLRSLLAPVLLLATVVASFFASLGASWLLFQSVFHFPALDTYIILLSFLFLVALGIDYNIFLITRAQEEAVVHGTRAGMIRALASTGGVITGAGILLAAVFAVLGVLPLITLTQIGVVVCVGVLLDTLVVRTIVVPALVLIAGDRFWWPRRVSPPITENARVLAASRSGEVTTRAHHKAHTSSSLVRKSQRMSAGHQDSPSTTVSEN